MRDERRLAAIMFTDMVGYTALMGRDESYARTLVKRSRVLLKDLVERYNGRWLEEIGDGTLSAFDSAIDAVDCAIAIQQVLFSDQEIRLRIGIHLGDVVFSGGRIYGDGVNVASRIEGLAQPGGIAVTDTVVTAVRGHSGIQIKHLGRKRLKNVDQPLAVYSLHSASGRLKSPGSFWRGLWTRRIPHYLCAYAITAMVIVWAAHWFAGRYGFHEQWLEAVIAAVIVMTPGVVAFAFFRSEPVQDRRSADGERRWHPGRFALSVNLLAMLALVAVMISDAPLPGEAVASVAVLPFANVSADEGNNEYFSDGLTEELINALSQVDALNVAARTSSFMYKGTQKEVQKIARELNVQHILDGSVRKSGDQLRVFVQLVDARTGFNVWQQTYEKSIEDVFSVQEDIARSVVSHMGVILPPRESARLSRRPTESLEAYNFYLQGLDYLHRPPTNSNLNLAENLFRNALTLDSNYAQGYSGLCRVALQRYQLSNDPDLIDAGEESCQSAMELDASLHEVRVALGNLYLETGRLEEARNLFETAIRNSPRQADGWIGLGSVLSAMEDVPPERAEETLRHAVELQPADWATHMALGEFFYWNNRFDEADAAFQNVMELTPENPRALHFMGSAYLVMGRVETSIKTLSKSLQLTPTRQGYRDLGLAYYLQGDYQRALELMDQAIELAPDDHWTWGSRADALRHLGRHTEAEAAYKRAAELARAVLERNPANSVTRAVLAVYLARTGDTSAASEALHQALNEAPSNPEIAFYGAEVELVRGDEDRALELMNQALRNGFSSDYLAMDPDLSELRAKDSRQGTARKQSGP